MTPQQPGDYVFVTNGAAVPDPDCDQPPCENWFPGNYSVYFGTIFAVIMCNWLGLHICRSFVRGMGLVYMQL